MKFDKLVESILEAVDVSHITSTVFGDYGRPASRGLKGILSKLTDYTGYDPKTGAPRYNIRVITKELKALGLSQQEIDDIRRKTIAAAKRAQDVILQKYDNIFSEISPNHDIKLNLKNPESFQIYNIFSYDNSWEPMLEFNKLFRDNLTRLLSKSPSK